MRRWRGDWEGHLDRFERKSGLPAAGGGRGWAEHPTERERERVTRRAAVRLVGGGSGGSLGGGGVGMSVK